MGAYRGIRNAGIALIALGVLGASPAFASPESDELSRDGLRQLSAGDSKAAVASFVNATKADPDDGRAYFYLGVGLNRIGNPHNALIAFRRAIALKAIHKDLGFEAGWAALEAGDFGAAAIMLGGHLELNREHAKTHELLGRTYWRLGQYDRAESLLRKAIELDPALESTALPVLATIELARGNKQGAGEALAGILNKPVDDPVRKNLIESLEPTEEEAAAAAKPWTVFGSTALGRNSNVIALSDQIVQPTDITGKHSRYVDINAGGQYRLAVDVDKAITAGGTLSHRNYRDLRGKDTHAANLFARYDQAINNNFLTSVTGSFSHTQVDGDKFQTTAGISPSLRYRINNRVRLDAVYSATKINLPDPTTTPAILDRNSTLQNFGGSITIGFPDIKTDVSFGGAYLLNSAVGTDYDYRGRRLNLAAQTQLPWDVVGGVGMTRTTYTYKNLNSLANTTPAGVTAFGFSRDDTITSYTATLTRPINENLSAYTRFTRTNADSNLAVFTYDQKDFLIGITARF
ncbi:MAG: tetratricopeptide repeat protein [Rhodospirillaceae bacterium]|nr:tetratricopeptide repeat protein [Rhodospirillaceae bacterium]MBT4773172.1 tetratricopeptide repeat protein [Rhodospirillaceae bacterium]MBT5358352.1 tetratricopeptide repeat protein [Rhodospirillaceae bacterium]MBT5771102.1 tetratricopeptide repeat protein [Rhodospirillaceae bacterium]MBT6308721.1 tetratricopeptide repeat protein [Rhodospirillaceae bacterium]